MGVRIRRGPLCLTAAFSRGSGPGRLAIGSAALGLLAAARREPLPSRRDIPAIAVCGVFWFGLYNIALNEAERRVDAGTAAMLVNMGRILKRSYVFRSPGRLRMSWFRRSRSCSGGCS